MYLAKIKNSSIALCLLLLPLSAWAAGLGQLNVSSAIGEPLKASIELLSVTEAERSTLSVRLASEEVYLTQGIERTAFHKHIKTSIGKASGKDVIKLSSDTPLAEPFVDMLIVLEWSNGRVLRQYTALLDPPTYQPKTAPVQKPSSNSFDNSSIKKDTATTDKAATSGKISAAKRAPIKEHLTRRGDTLYKIARRMKPAGANLDEVLVALFEANPDAFDGHNMNRLKVGKILQAPTQDALDAMTRKKAVREIKLQTADWHEYRNRLARKVAKSAAKESGEDTQSTSGKIKSAAEDQAEKGKQSKDVVKLSASSDAKAKDGNTQAKITALQEEIVAREKGLQDAQEKTALLEKQIADMEKLLVLKDDALAAAQAQSAEKTENIERTPESAADVKSEEMSADMDKTADAEAPTEHVEQPVGQANEEPVTPDAAKEEQPAKPEVADSAPPAEQPSFLASLINTAKGVLSGISKTILLAVAGLLALLLLIWLYYSNKRKKTLDDFEQSIMTSGSLKTNTVFGDTVTSTVAAGDTSFLTDFSQSSASGLIDANEVDPIAEAEVYMAYGRDAQAEEILKDAIAKEPQRHELHLKLLDLYAANNNTSAFETVAGEMYSTLGAEHPTWQKVAEIGAKLEPNNPLYQQAKQADTDVGATDNEATPALAPEPALTPEPAVMAEPEVEQAPEPVSSPMETVVGGAAAEQNEDKLDASDFSDSPLAAEADLDFSIADGDGEQNALADVAAGAEVEPTTVASDDVSPAVEETSTPPVDTADGLEFSLDTVDGDQPLEGSDAPVNADQVESSPSLDFPEMEVPSADASTELQAEEAIEETLGEATELEIPNDLSLDIASEPVEDASSATDFDFGDGVSSAPEEAPSGVMDMSDISLDVANEAPAPEEAPQETLSPAVGEPEDATPANEEVETKLELVAAYIDMEDKEGATELLEEVLKEGNLAQRKRADQMLKSLA